MLIRIMGCREREDNINKMLLSLPKNTEVIWDTDHNPCHTLQRVVDSDESILIMEDDIELCKDFFNKAKAEIDKRPKVFTMFYSCKTGEEEEAKNIEQGIPYDRSYVYTQAYYLPAGLGKKLSKFLETNHRANNHRWSKGINEFLKKEGIPRYLVQPSLVQHIATDSLNEPNVPFQLVMHQSKTYRYE